MPLISVVVPVLADAAALTRLFEGLAPDPRLELIVVDGGDGGSSVPPAALRGDVRLVRSAQGRARQMNAGAACAMGEWLLFLHADSRVPGGWIDALLAHASTAEGGWFRFALDDSAWQARMIERAVAWRVRWLRLPYGDQGFFVRRTTFAALGGYRELPLMEDIEFIRRLQAVGSVVEVPAPLCTSARRYRRDGWFRRTVWNVILVALYFAGVSPSRLAAWYDRPLFFRTRRLPGRPTAEL